MEKMTRKHLSNIRNNADIHQWPNPKRNNASRPGDCPETFCTTAPVRGDPITMRQSRESFPLRCTWEEIFTALQNPSLVKSLVDVTGKKDFTISLSEMPRLNWMRWKWLRRCQETRRLTKETVLKT